MKTLTLLCVTIFAIFLAACGAAGVNVATIDAAMQASAARYGSTVSEENPNARPALSVKHNAAACPVTKPGEPLFVPPAPYPPVAPYGGFWYGSDSLWTMMYADGQWSGLPNDGAGFTNKVFWWHPGFDGTKENSPVFKLTAEQLDGDGFWASTQATNAYHKDFGGWTILTGVEIPSTGCWAITGEYKGESLTFVVQIEKE